jgi:hypothetical protein
VQKQSDLIHGQVGKMTMNKRRKNSTKSLDTVLGNETENPILQLERRVTQLEKDVATLKRQVEWPAFTRNALTAKKIKPGVKERIEDEQLFKCRDGLIRWLEAYWPWLEDRLYQAKSAEEVGAILEAVSEEPYLRRDWQKRLLPNPQPLFDFISDQRFRRNLPTATVKDALDGSWNDVTCRRATNKLPARQVANAMAGVPDIGWRRSLDRCSVQPSSVRIALNMDLYYREVYGIPIPANRDLTNATSPVPRSSMLVSNVSKAGR